MTEGASSPEEGEITDGGSPSARAPRVIRTLAVAAAVLAVILVWTVTGSGPADEVETAPHVDGATVQLDAALAAGVPVYILIHSET